MLPLLLLGAGAYLFVRHRRSVKPSSVVGREPSDPVRLKHQFAACADLVERSRMLDQNAMAMIAAIRENAARQDPVAINSANMIARYCIMYPAKPKGPLGQNPQLPVG